AFYTLSLLEWLGRFFSNVSLRAITSRLHNLQEKIFGFQQGTQSVTKYFTELVILYDELRNFHPIPDCACSLVCSCSLAKIRLYQEQDFVIQFLRGLNDNFSSPRSQVMLLEPLPSLNKVFAMMI
ncbi:hypothetical protein LINPERHAP1_LOCUS9432, partial [Linum perenne]